MARGQLRQLHIRFEDDFFEVRDLLGIQLIREVRCDGVRIGRTAIRPRRRGTQAPLAGNFLDPFREFLRGGTLREFLPDDFGIGRR